MLASAVIVVDMNDATNKATETRLAELVNEQRAKYPGHSEAALVWGAERRLMWEQVKAPKWVPGT